MSARPPLLVIDTETTGSSTEINQIVELAAIAADPETHAELWRASQCIRREPWAQLEPFAMAVHKLPVQDPAWHASAHPLADVLRRFAARLGGERYIVVGHGLPFDLRHVRASYARCSLVLPPCFAERAPTEDTLALAQGLQRRGLLPSALRVNLTALCLHFGIPIEGAHRALRDAEHTLALYRKLRAIVRQSTLPAQKS